MSTYRKDLKRILKCCESLFYICAAILICHSQIVTVTRRLGISTDLTALPLLCIAERSGPLYAQILLCPQWQTVSTALELVDLTSPDKLNLHQPSHLQIKPRTVLQANCYVHLLPILLTDMYSTAKNLDYTHWFSSSWHEKHFRTKCSLWWEIKRNWKQ